MQSVRYYARSWLPARAIVSDCIADRKEADSSGEILVLKHFCPVSSAGYQLQFNICLYSCLLSATDIWRFWLTDVNMCLQWKQHLAELEEELKIEPTIKYVLYEVMQIAADVHVFNFGRRVAYFEVMTKWAFCLSKKPTTRLSSVY